MWGICFQGYILNIIGNVFQHSMWGICFQGYILSITGNALQQCRNGYKFNPTLGKPCRLKYICRNPNLGFATKARGCKVAGQKGSVRECEGIDFHIPKAIPTLGVGISMDSRMFKEKL